MASILADFAEAVRRHPRKIAIVDGEGRSFTFAELGARADDLARAWRARGVGAGDRVLLAMTLDADLYASLAALWSLNATVVLPEPAMGVAGLRHAARVADVTAFCSSGAYGLLRIVAPELWSVRHLRPRGAGGEPFDAPAPAEADLALISFTSGTTGPPKAIPRSHGFLAAQHDAIAPLLESAAAERDLVAFPVFVLINIAGGQTSVLPSWRMSRLAKLPPARLNAWIARQNASRALLPPSLCEKLAMTSVPSSLRTVFVGGGPVFPDILEKLKSAGTDLRVICVYGSTEAEPIAHLDADDIGDDDHARMIAGRGLLVGYPVDGLQVRIAEDEIQVAGSHVNGGYLNPDHDSENKIREGATVWHRTGDAGYLDDLGRLWLLGRVGSQIDLSGRPVFPFSVEVAARGWEGVTQCAFIPRGEGASLAIEGDARFMETWRTKAGSLGIDSVTRVARMPMDKRHASKVDRNALSELMTS